MIFAVFELKDQRKIVLAGDNLGQFPEGAVSFTYFDQRDPDPTTGAFFRFECRVGVPVYLRTMDWVRELTPEEVVNIRMSVNYKNIYLASTENVDGENDSLVPLTADMRFVSSKEALNDVYRVLLEGQKNLSEARCVMKTK